MKNYNKIVEQQDNIKADPDLEVQVRVLKRMNFRKASFVSDNIIRELRGGEKLTVLANKDEWLKVKDFKNVTGYVMSKYVEEV